MRELMKKRVLLLMAVMLLLSCGAAAQMQELIPALEDPQDQKVQRLSVMSQRAAAFEGILYNNGYLSARGCQPVSLANALIAIFGVENEEAAAGAVKETAQLLALPGRQGKTKIELTRIPKLLNPQERLEQAEKYPFLAEIIGRYSGAMHVTDKQLDADMLEQVAAQAEGGFVLAGRMTVHPDWTKMLEVVSRLHELGLDDALLCLANVGAGREESGVPLGLGASGHYLTLMLHTGTFMQEGRIYVLDSLPRALEGEKSGYEYVLRSPYPFVQGMKSFNETMQAARIRDTVIRLTMRDPAAWTAAETQEKAKLLGQLILYGPGVLMIAVP